PFAVDVIHAEKIRERDVDLNRLLNGVAGVRVKETGGMGSEFNYSIHGLSGKAIKFFIDGIPMENFGTGFSINNFPVNVIERIEVYKGVSPVELGGDALGGSINIVTRKDFSNYLDVSLSTGSFNTQRAALSFKWRSKASGLTLSANSFHNSSANDYKVWGRTVEIAGPGNKPITGLRFRRFNDDYSSSVIQSEIGLTRKKWADEILIGVTASAIDKGIQTGRTMAFVFGDARFTESFFMPTLKYSKKGLLNNRLAINFYASVNKLNATTIDTGSRKYNWAGEVVATGKSGEIGGINSGRSILSIKDQTSLVRLNLSYVLFENQSLNFNFNLNNVSRSGADEFSSA
ncbi:MAG: Plug domain-containing protein, partial [Pedobacter sp.]